MKCHILKRAYLAPRAGIVAAAPRQSPLGVAISDVARKYKDNAAMHQAIQSAWRLLGGAQK